MPLNHQHIKLTRWICRSSVRALGETDLNPVSAIGKISQLLFGLIQPNNVVANLIAGGISEAGAMQCGEIMQDFKTGYLHHVSPKSMFYGQASSSPDTGQRSVCIYTRVESADRLS